MTANINVEDLSDDERKSSYILCFLLKASLTMGREPVLAGHITLPWTLVDLH